MEDISMDTLQKLSKQFESPSLPKDEKFRFYTDNILPIVADRLHQQLTQHLSYNKKKPYTSLVTILSHNIHPTLLAITSIRPQHCVIFYTSEKSKALKKLLDILAPLSIHIETIELDRINHNDNFEKIKQIIRKYNKIYPPVLCDITGGKKIMSTNIGIIAHALKVDIAYIDANEYIEGGIPQPGGEVLYIQDPKGIIQFEANQLNKLRIGYNAETSTISFQADIGNRSHNLQHKTIKTNEKETISHSLHNFYDCINASILYQDDGIHNELQRLQNVITGLLLTKDVKSFLKKNTFPNLHLVIDEEVSSIPWELVLQQYDIALPIIRIPNRNREFQESKANVKSKTTALIIGSGQGISDFDSFVNQLKFSLSKHKEATLKTFDASDANKLKLFFAEHNHTPFEIILYYGHAIFGSDHSTTGLLCKDNSIFSIEDCEVFESAPCKCMIVNACQSARGNSFEKNSFAYAALKAGVDTYIGTHFFLESQRSKLFVQTFLESIIQGKSFFEAFNDSYNALKQKFGPYDVSTYNYVYYGN